MPVKDSHTGYWREKKKNLVLSLYPLPHKSSRAKVVRRAWGVKIGKDGD